MNQLRDGVWVAFMAGAVTCCVAATTWSDQGEEGNGVATQKIERSTVASVGDLVRRPHRSTTTGLLDDLSMTSRGGGLCDSSALCDGDANGDGVVDPLDSGAILARFGLDPCSAGNCQFDVNCDGVIDPLDSGYVLARFGVCNPPIDCSTPGCGSPPNDNCEDVTPVLLPVGVPVTLFGDNTGATGSCDALDEGFEVWEAFTTEEVGLTVIIDFCGTEPTLSPAYIVIDDSCPCDGAFIFAESFGFEECIGGDTNIIIEHPDLPAGTYYVPVYSDPADGAIGPYVMNLSASFPSGDCCEVHPQPGCDNVCGDPDSSVEICVCAVDDFCCNVTWDSACVELVELFSCADCSDNNPNCIAPSNCCEDNPGVGCDDPLCEALICNFDPFCCDVDWDALCEGEALTCCETCGGDPSDPLCEPAKACGDPEAGSCCIENGTPGCDDEFCCLTICPILPSCCDTEWTQTCADQAVDLCDDACP